MAESVRELILRYFQSHPNVETHHGPVVDWVTEQWLQTHDTPPRDPWRTIRKLHQEGLLIKVRKGVYKYDPEHILSPTLEDFTAQQKDAIFRRDGYRCVVCGRGRADGVEIHADHIIPKDLGGQATLSNGQTLCSVHNFRKKNYQQTETGKRMFIRLHELAQELGDSILVQFCKEILQVYEKYGINGHIDWDAQR